MYESCSNRNLFGVVRSRTSSSGPIPSLQRRFARTRVEEITDLAVRCHGELYDPGAPVPDSKDSPTLAILARYHRGVSDVTKIIVFRNTEGGTTAFDKTFSTIRS